MNPLETVASELAQQRARLGISLDDAAARSQIEPERLAGAENGELALNENELQRLAGTYGIDVTAFFGGRVTPLSYLFGA